jgi:hypothetical protein
MFVRSDSKIHIPILQIAQEVVWIDLFALALVTLGMGQLDIRPFIATAITKRDIVIDLVLT